MKNKRNDFFSKMQLSDLLVCNRLLDRLMVALQKLK